jgi:hypothetical protein
MGRESQPFLRGQGVPVSELQRNDQHHEQLEIGWRSLLEREKEKWANGR